MIKRIIIFSMTMAALLGIMARPVGANEDINIQTQSGNSSVHVRVTDNISSSVRQVSQFSQQLQSIVVDNSRDHVSQVRNNQTLSCDGLQNVLSARVDLTTREKNSQVRMMRQWENSMLARADAFDQQGLDTGKFRADINTLDGMINQMAEDFNQSRNKLSSLQQTDCTNIDLTAFRTRIRTADDQPRADMKNILDFMRGTLQQDLRDLMTQ